MGGRGGSSGLSRPQTARKNKQSYDERFKRYDEQGEIIYRTSPSSYFIYDYETDNIAAIHRSLKAAKEDISEGIAARKREIEQIEKKVSDGKASESEKERLSRLIKRESARRRRVK